MGQRRLSRDSIQRVEPRGRSLCHSDCDRAVQRHHRRWANLKQGVIEKNDPLPVRIRYGVGSRVTSSDCRLQCVTVGAATQLLRAMERKRFLDWSFGHYLDVAHPSFVAGSPARAVSVALA